jgi:hypothetical protein
MPCAAVEYACIDLQIGPGRSAVQTVNTVHNSKFSQRWLSKVPSSEIQPAGYKQTRKIQMFACCLLHAVSYFVFQSNLKMEATLS